MHTSLRTGGRLGLLTLLTAACAARPAPEADLRAIEDLHARDAKAARAQDFDALAELWTSDGVLLAPGGPALRGAALFAQLEQASWQEPTQEVLDYAFELDEVEVVGDFAFEWGVLRGASRDLTSGRTQSTAYQILRILKREGGVWRVHRAIWNELDEEG